MHTCEVISLLADAQITAITLISANSSKNAFSLHGSSPDMNTCSVAVIIVSLITSYTLPLGRLRVFFHLLLLLLHTSHQRRHHGRHHRRRFIAIIVISETARRESVEIWRKSKFKCLEFMVCLLFGIER